MSKKATTKRPTPAKSRSVKIPAAKAVPSKSFAGKSTASKSTTGKPAAKASAARAKKVSPAAKSVSARKPAPAKNVASKKPAKETLVEARIDEMRRLRDKPRPIKRAALEELALTFSVPAPVSRVFTAWLDAREHAAMTASGPATSEPRVGGQYTAAAGYIRGAYSEISPNRRIQCTWRTTDFPEDAAYSQLSIMFDPAPGGTTTVTLRQTHIPAGQGKRYEQGWKKYYFAPMNDYFLKQPK